MHTTFFEGLPPWVCLLFGAISSDNVYLKDYLSLTSIHAQQHTPSVIYYILRALYDYVFPIKSEEFVY